MKENILKLLHKCEEKLKKANNKTTRKISVTYIVEVFLFVLN